MRVSGHVPTRAPVLAADVGALIGQTTLANHHVSLAAQLKVAGFLQISMLSVFILENIIDLSRDTTGSKLLIYSGSLKRTIISEDYAGLCFVCVCKCSGDYLC